MTLFKLIKKNEKITNATPNKTPPLEFITDDKINKKIPKARGIENIKNTITGKEHIPSLKSEKLML